VLTVCIAGEPSFGMIVVVVGGVVARGGGIFGLEVDGVHYGVVLAALVGGEFGARADEEEEGEGEEAVEVG
jgi:hypothetical protein